MTQAMASFTDTGDEDDAAFLSAIAEAEADGLRRLSQEGDSSRKHERQHAEPAESASSSLPHGAGYGDGGYTYRDKEAAPKRSRVEPEGEYMAALRGTHSETWQAMSSKDAKPRHGAASSYSRSANLGFDGARAQGGSSGVCFHCGKGGHTVRDCPFKATMRPSRWGPEVSNIPGQAQAQAQAPQRSCPCGGGACLVLTANTEKNAGRQFYRCPLRKEEGQCGFFEWCDGITGSNQGLSKEQGSSDAHSEFPCPCGAGPCTTLTAKTEKNMGRQFYKCPLNQDEGQCGFFEWCDGITGSNQGLSKEQGSSDAHSEFPCPCGAGPCTILTAKTEKNMGRQFYKCPLNQEEGQCGFFEWCDGITGSNQGLPKEQGSSYTHLESPCPCGAGPCIILTAKTEKNMGRQFYRCPLNQGEGSCGFFKWCDESAPASGATAPAYGGSAFAERSSMPNVATGQCYKCGMDGHWANNCPNQLFSHGSKGAVRGFNRQGGENNFSRGFPNASGYGSPGTGRHVGTVRSASSGCSKCGSDSHWSKDCPNASNTRQTSYGGHSQGAYYGQASFSGRFGGSGSCYKCGGQGHRANECRADGKGGNMY